jgi:hypothetical protein
VGFRNFFIAHLPKLYQSKNETKKKKVGHTIFFEKKLLIKMAKKWCFLGSLVSNLFLKNSFNIKIRRIYLEF